MEFQRLLYQTMDHNIAVHSLRTLQVITGLCTLPAVRDTRKQMVRQSVRWQQ